MKHNPQILIIPLIADIKLSQIFLDSIKGKNLLIGSIGSKPYKVIDILINNGNHVEYMPIDTEDRFLKTKVLFHDFYSDCHTIFRKNVPQKYHRWYWITKTSEKLGPISPECIFTALYLYVFQFDIFRKYPDIEYVYIIGGNPYLRYINFPIKTIIIPYNSKLYGVSNFKKVLVGIKFIFRALINTIHYFNGQKKNTRVDCAFLIGNYWKQINGNRKIDVYFDSLPYDLQKEGISVERISNTLLLYNYDKNCEIDRIINGNLIDALFAFRIYSKIIHWLKGITIEDSLVYKKNPEWLKDLSLYKHFLLENSKILFIGLILYREYLSYIFIKEPKIICFCDEIGYSRKALQLAVNDSICDRKPKTVGFQHGWVYYTRFSHNYISDHNEIDNPFPIANYYLVYNEIARNVYSELSNYIKKEDIIITGMHRIETYKKDLFKIYYNELKHYDLRLLFIDGGIEYTRECKGLLEEILSLDKIALIIKPHPYWKSDLKIINELSLKKRSSSKLWYSDKFHLETIIQVSDAVILNSSTVFLNAIFMNRPIIYTNYDEERVDWYGLKQGLKNVPGFYPINSPNEVLGIINHLKNKNFQKVDYLSPGNDFIPPLLGKKSSDYIINYVKAILKND